MYNLIQRFREHHAKMVAGAHRPAKAPVVQALIESPTECVISPNHCAHQVNLFEKRYRVGNSGYVQLLGGDGPAALTMIVDTAAKFVNTANIPWVAPALNALNVANAITGYVGICADLRVNYDALKNPHATKKDIAVDWIHFLIGDLVNTGASMVPLFCSLSNPVAYGIFMGGQAIGMYADYKKWRYDIKREGQQSALPDANADHRLVLDRIEQRFNRLGNGMTVAALQAQILAPHFLPTLTGILGSFGGSMSLVGGFNQWKKSKDLVAKYTADQAAGQAKVAMPIWGKGHNLVEKDIAVEQAIAIAKQRRGLGLAQMISGGLVTATSVASALGLAIAPPLAVGALAVAIGTLVVNAAADAMTNHRLSKVPAGTAAVNEQPTVAA